MATDLVNRLREASKDWVDCGPHCDLEIEAADHIERLNRELYELRQESMTWAMVCDCNCKACEHLFDSIKNSSP